MENEEEMDIGEGEQLEVLVDEGDWILCRKFGGKAVGFVPANYLEVSDLKSIGTKPRTDVEL